MDYEQETGENALCVGYPFICLPPGNDLIGAGSPTPRIVAPLGLIAVDMSVKRGAVQSVSLSARSEGMDLVIPNCPLFAWLENQTGKDLRELFADEEGNDLYFELAATRRKEFQLETAQTETTDAVVHSAETPHPSPVARWLADTIARDDQKSSDVHWGNDGFCVDVAFHHSKRPGQRALGVLCDLYRFEDAPDLVDWELFRTQLLQGKGWKFHHVFSPALFRDWNKHHGELLDVAVKLESKLKLPKLIAPEPEDESNDEIDSVVVKSSLVVMEVEVQLLPILIG